MKSNVELRQKNMLMLLRAIRENGPIHKRQLQVLTGLSWGTVSIMTSELIESGYVRVLGKQSTDAGRRPDMLDINDQDYLSIGIDFHDTGIIGVTADMKGRILRGVNAQFQEMDRSSALQTLFTVLDQLLAFCEGRRVLGIAFAMQGIVDVNLGISVKISRIEDWTDVPLKALVEERYQLPVWVIHDPDCLMKTEQVIGITGMNRAQNALLLRMEKYGIGMSVLIAGRQYIGTKGKAGEIGKTYVVHPGTGETILLEHCVCEMSVIKNYDMISGSRCDSVKKLAKMARQGDKRAANAFEWMGGCLGMALVNAINLFNPELITLDGHMSSYADLFGPRMEEVIHRDAYDDSVKIKVANLDSNASALGAALIVVDRYLAEVCL